MYKRTAVEFAVDTKNGVVRTVGKSYIMTPKPQCKKHNIKWFDDAKLIRR